MSNLCVHFVVLGPNICHRNLKLRTFLLLSWGGSEYIIGFRVLLNCSQTLIRNVFAVTYDIQSLYSISDIPLILNLVGCAKLMKLCSKEFDLFFSSSFIFLHLYFCTFFPVIIIWVLFQPSWKHCQMIRQLLSAYRRLISHEGD